MPKPATKREGNFDPPRYPKLINPIEGAMKKKFDVMLGKMKVDFTKKLIDSLK